MPTTATSVPRAKTHWRPKRSESQPPKRLPAAGERLLGRLGLDLAGARRERRAFARQCLDWSERRAHLAGSLGAALARRCLDLRWVRRVDEQRALALTPQGRRALRTWFGILWTG